MHTAGSVQALYARSAAPPDKIRESRHFSPRPQAEQIAELIKGVRATKEETAVYAEILETAT